ncbi:MAG: hypothetical protein GX624_09540 [Actinobacteria bacterium]|nr:hypothetical protein [Actinomycetota bacterium]
MRVDETPGSAEVRRGLVGLVRAGDASLEQSAAAVTTARGGAELRQSASVAVVSGGDTDLTMAAAVAVPTLGDVKIDKGGAQWVVAAGDVSIDRGGAGVAVAPSVRVERGLVGMALGWHVDVGSGGRVLFGPKAAAAFGLAAGLAAGVILVAGGTYAAGKTLKRVPGLPWAS